MKRRRQRSVDLEEELGGGSGKRKKESQRNPWDVPPHLYQKTDLCNKLYDVLRGFKDTENRLLCEFLVRVPNRRSIPEYYKIVQHPIDLIRIQQKLKTDGYENVPIFLSDIRLLINNSKTYYRPSSEEHKRAVAFEKEFLRTLQEISEYEDLSLLSPTSPKTVSLKLSKFQYPMKSPATPKTTPTSHSSRLKTTRSKAWLDQYSESADPIKVFFASVYTYHDGNGEHVSQPFLELPSRKDYPEYYRIIVEPIDLTMIRRNIESGNYTNLREIQEDILLMIKNAQYFNEPGSIIYKMATTLRKFAINRCLELERRYKTVDRTVQKVKSPPPGSGAGVKGQRSRKFSDLAEESESGDELSASDSEGEGDGDDSRGKHALHSKHEKVHDSEHNSLTKIFKSKSQPPLKKLLQTMYHTLTTAVDKEDRLISEMFMKRPSSRLYPEYYIVINKPIDFREISKKIKHKEYKSLGDLMSDIELLVNNACHFNQEDSQIHTDALKLREIAHKVYDQIKSTWGTPPHDFSSAPMNILEKTGEKYSEQDTIKILLITVQNSRDLTGRKLWLTVKDPPPSPKEIEGYSGTGRKTLGLMAISLKADKKEYSSLDVLFSDLCNLFHSYCDTFPAHTSNYKDAVMLHRVSVTKYMELSQERRNSFRYPNAPEALRNLLKDIMKRLLSYKDDNGSCLSECLQHVVVTLETANKEEGKTRRVFSLRKINKWVTSGRYSRLDQLQTDLLMVFKQAREDKEEGRVGVAKLSRELEKVYITIRDDVCGDGKILYSPALHQRTLKHFEEEKSLSVSFEEEEEEEEAMESDNIENKPNLEVLPPPEERMYCDSLTCNDVTYEPGEYVYLPSREPHLPPQISLIESLWTDKNENLWFDGCWFPRPHETYHIASRKFYEKEVFKSDFYSTTKLTQVVGKCCVLFIKDYMKYQPQGFSESDLFVCESRYFCKQKSMKKIKSWNIQYKYQPTLVQRLTPCSLNKIPSVFVSGNESNSSRSDRNSSEPLEQVPVSETMEQDSVCEQIQAEHDIQRDRDSNEDVDDIKTEEKENEDEEEEEDSLMSNILEMSFIEDLKEVPATVLNPEENHTYFEQYCIDDKLFRLGDFVCVRSDQQHPFIARIDRMWTDVNEDPWFHGPWFVRVGEIEHVPTRMFYEREVFLSNIQDTNPMRSIMRKCVVLYPTEYCKLRLTEIPESDVFVCECKYNEVDKSIKKQKGLKQFQLSDSVLSNEMYYLPEELYMWKCHSPKLYPKTTPIPITSPVSQQSSVQPLSLPATPTTAPLITLPTATGHFTLTLQQLQSLIASQLAGGKPTLTPVSQTPLSVPQSSNTTPLGISNNILAYPCVWDGCSEIFEDSLDLGAHIIRSNHLRFELDGFYCYWNGCPRTKEHSGRPFDTLQKITRHVKEVHMLRVIPRQVSIDQLGTNFHRRGVFLKDSISLPQIPPVQPIISQSILTTPTHPVLATPTQIFPSVSITPSTTTPTQNSVSIATTQVLGTPIHISQTVTATPISAVSQTNVDTTQSTPARPHSQPTEDVAMETTPPSIFIPPPKNQREVVHSKIYQNYIERMRNNESTMTPTRTQTTKPNQPITPAIASEWIDPDAIPVGMSVTQALHHLHDYMMNDALKIKKWLE